MEVMSLKNIPLESSGTESAKTNQTNMEYRPEMYQLFEGEIRDIAKEEIKNGIQELLEEQRKVIKQILDDSKVAIQRVTEEEKKVVWTKSDELRKSIVCVTQ